MNLRAKKELSARALKVGKERIMFVHERKEEIKEAITKQDIKDLHKDGAVKIKEISGRKTKISKRSRSPGNVRKKVNTRKQDYVIMTRKLRAYVKALRERGELGVEEAKDIRNKIRNKYFKSKANLKDYVLGLRK
jgi:large subunit ribosomal protein L19e